MGLNDKLKGSYYKNYEAVLASRTAIHNILDELKSYYNNLIGLIQNTYDKITTDRTEMVEKLNAILVKINYIEYSIDNFQLEVDSSLEEKLKKLMENYDNDFVSFIEEYDTNLYNHSKLTDQSSSNTVNYTQPLSEYEKSVEKLNSDIGIRWFGGKFNDRYLCNKLNSLLHIVKSNKYEGLSLEDYDNSNLILDIFIYSTKGITWLKLGKNATFGYNIQVKYHSLKDRSINIKVESNSYYTPKNYDINEFDLNMLIDFGYKEEDLKNGNVYIKIKTNVPSNTFSGLEEYYISGSDSINEYNDNRIIKNLGKRHISHNNRDYGYNINNTIKTLKELRTKNSKFDKETDYIGNFITDKYSKLNRVSNDKFEIYTEISPISETDNEKNVIKGTTKRITDDKEIVGINESINPIVVNPEKSTEIDYNNSYLEDSDKLANKEDENENILYVEEKQRVDLLDYHNVGDDIGLIAKNENTFMIDNGVSDNDSTVVNGTKNSLKTAKIPALLNEVTNNSLLDINKDNSFEEIATKVSTFNEDFGGDLEIYKKDNDLNGNLLILAGNNTIRYIYKIKNIDDFETIKINDSVIYDFLFLNNGNLYLFTDNGIKYISKENYENDNFVIEDTNIISGKFTTACLSKDEKSFYTISDQGTYMTDTEKNNYRLSNFFYIYDPETMLIKDYGDYCDFKNLDDSAIRYDNESDITPLITSSSGYKLLRYEYGSKWYLLNKQSGTVFESKDENFGYFKLIENISGLNGINVHNEIVYGNYDNYLLNVIDDKLIPVGRVWSQSNELKSGHYCLKSINDTIIAVSSYLGGIYYSEDNGKTWNRSNITSGSFIDPIIIEDRVIIVGSRSDKGIYYSEDNGKTWNQSNITSGYVNSSVTIGNTIIMNYYIQSNSRSSDKGIYYSEDNGKTWNQSNITSGSLSILAVINDVVIGEYFTNRDYSQGIYYSEDNGKTWNQSNITSGYVNSSVTIGNTIIMNYWIYNNSSTSYKGLYYSEDNGKTWNQSNITSDRFNHFVTINDVVIAGGDSASLYYSEDNGKTWNQSDVNSDNKYNSGTIKQLLVMNNKVIAIYFKRIYYSEDNGKTWNQSDVNGDDYKFNNVTISTNSIAIINDIIISPIINKGMCYSEDDGKTWNQSNLGDCIFDRLIVNGNNVIIGIYTDINSKSKGIYYSEDNGKTWNQSNITSGYVNSSVTIGNTIIMNYWIYNNSSTSYKGLYYSEFTCSPSIYRATSYEENTIDKYKRKIQLDSLDTILDSQDLPTLESELTTPVKYYGSGFFDINGQTYIAGEHITDFVYVNGYYYALLPSGNIIYKLNKNKTLVSKISIDNPIKLLSANNSLIILAKDEDEQKICLYTDKETIKSYPELYDNVGGGVYIIAQ